MTSGIELNCEGLVGPTHHYGGLAYGNLASILHAHQPSNPREAALQSLAKMRLLHRLNIPQAVIPPQARPNLSLLEHAGFTGTPTELIQQAARDAPHLLSAAYSAASMWTANAATVTPSADSANHRVHFTPANCVSGLHRHQEAAFTGQLLKKLFSNPSYFEHHPPLPATEAFADEGAANHNRICAEHNTKGLHLFVYGRSGLQSPTHFPARQTMDASKAVARLHQLNPKDVIFAQQNPKAIDAGVFHHDVIGVANESVLLIHAEALLQQADVINRLREACPFPLCVIEVPGQAITLSDAIKSFMFNSELITRAPNDMLLVAPTTCQAIPKVAAFLQDLIANPNNPIQEVCFVNLTQSMHNGGGPACLRLRVVLNKQEYRAMHQEVLVNERLLDTLEDWVCRHYRTGLEVTDLSDMALMHESHKALDELTTLLDLGPIYPFQKKFLETKST